MNGDMETMGIQKVKSSGRSLLAAVPSDTVDQPPGSIGLYVGVAGDVKLTAELGDIAVGGTVLKNVPAGTLLPIAVRRIWAAGTTATNMVVVY